MFTVAKNKIIKKKKKQECWSAAFLSLPCRCWNGADLECVFEQSLNNLPHPSNLLLLFFICRAEKTEVLSDDLLQVRAYLCGDLLVRH